MRSAHKSTAGLKHRAPPPEKQHQQKQHDLLLARHPNVLISLWVLSLLTISLKVQAKVMKGYYPKTANQRHLPEKPLLALAKPQGTSKPTKTWPLNNSRAPCTNHKVHTEDPPIPSCVPQERACAARNCRSHSTSPPEFAHCCR